MFLVAVIVVALVGGFAPAVLDRHRGIAAAQLLLHPAHPPVDDRGGEQRARDRRVRRRRGPGQLGRGHRGPAHQAGGPGQRGVRAAHHHGGQRAARPAGARARCWTGSARRSAWTRSRCSSARRRRPAAADASADRLRGTPGDWHVVASRGEPAVTRPDEADVEVPVDRLAARWRCAAGRCPPRTGACSARSPPTRPSRSTSSGWPPRRRRPSRSRPPTGCGPRCSPRSATTCAPRWRRPRPR